MLAYRLRRWHNIKPALGQCMHLFCWDDAAIQSETGCPKGLIAQSDNVIISPPPPSDDFLLYVDCIRVTYVRGHRGFEWLLILKILFNSIVRLMRYAG